MILDTHQLITFLHVLAFVYWLGGDLGVFIIAKRAAVPGMAFDERMRLRKILYDIDMAPRACLVAMVPLGFTLAQRHGVEFPAWLLTLIWIAAAVWMAMVWFLHFRGTTPLGGVIRTVDMGFRILVLIGFVGYGGYLLFGQSDVQTWLALKVFLFGFIIVNGIILRMSGGRSREALDMLKSGENIEEGERKLEAARRFGARWALCIWALVAIMGFLGVTKAFV